MATRTARTVEQMVEFLVQRDMPFVGLSKGDLNDLNQLIGVCMEFTERRNSEKASSAVTWRAIFCGVTAGSGGTSAVLTQSFGGAYTPWLSDRIFKVVVVTTDTARCTRCGLWAPSRLLVVEGEELVHTRPCAPPTETGALLR